MKNNLYTKAIVDIKADKKLIDSTVEKISRAGDNSTVIAFERPKRRALKFTSAVAAVLALIIGLSFISYGGNDAIDSEHNFVITVGAAEINPDVYVEVGELSESGSLESFRPIDQEAAIKNSESDNFEWQGEYDVLRIDRMFLPHELNVYGENIESITYTTNNCRLAYDSQFVGVVEVDEFSEDELADNGGLIHHYNKYLWAKSCTLDYAAQQEDIKSEKWYGIPKIGVEFAFEFEEGEHTVFMEDDLTSQTPLFVQEFNAHADEFSLDITANFKDGVSVTKTLKFSCESTNDRGLVLYAIEA